MKGFKAAAVGMVLALFAVAGCSTPHHTVVTYDSNGNVTSSQSVPDYNQYGYGYQNGYYFDYYNPLGIYINGLYYAPYSYRYLTPQRYYSVTPPAHVHLYSGTTKSTTTKSTTTTKTTAPKKVTTPRTTTTVPKTKSGTTTHTSTSHTGSSSHGGGSFGGGSHRH